MSDEEAKIEDVCHWMRFYSGEYDKEEKELIVGWLVGFFRSHYVGFDEEGFRRDCGE